MAAVALPQGFQLQIRSHLHFAKNLFNVWAKIKNKLKPSVLLYIRSILEKVHAVCCPYLDTMKLSLSHGDKGLALSAIMAIRPYGGWLPVSEELLLWDFPKHRWKCHEPKHISLSLFAPFSVSSSLCLFVPLFFVCLPRPINPSVLLFSGDSDRSIRGTKGFY